MCGIIGIITRAEESPANRVAADEIDIVVPLEGEKTFLELVDMLNKGGALKNVAGIVFKKNGNVIRNPDNLPVNIDEVNILPYELIDFSRYSNMVAGKKTIKFFPDRGCPHKCAFCTQNDYFPKTGSRQMSAATIYAYLKAFKRLGRGAVSMGDGSFLTYRRRLEELLDLLEKENPGLSIRCTGRIDDVNRMDDDFLKRLKQQGFFAFQIGVESGSNRVLELMNKKITVNVV